MATEVILHLTDLHFGYDEDVIAAAQRKLALSSLTSKVLSLSDGWKPTVVCITGDISYRNKPSGYLEAEKWLTDFLAKLGLNSSDVIACPGNHDVDRQVTSTLDWPTKAGEADQILRFPIADHHVQSVARFSDFCTRIGIPEYNLHTSHSYITGQVLHNTISYIVVNSCWFSKHSEKDKGNLWIGSPLMNLMEANDQLPLLNPSSPLTVLLFHHPFDWWHQDELHAYSQRPNTRDYLAHRCHVLLSGHTHGELRRADQIAERAWYFTGGATYAELNYRNNFRLIRIEPTQIAYRGFVYNPQSPNHQWIDQLGETTLQLYERGSIAASQQESATTPPSFTVPPIESIFRQVVPEPHESRNLLQIVPVNHGTLVSKMQVSGLEDIVGVMTSMSRGLLPLKQTDRIPSPIASTTSTQQSTMQWSDANGLSLEAALPIISPQLGLISLTARNHLDNITKLRNEFGFDKAIEATSDLKDWLTQQGEAVPIEEKCEAYLVLAEVERIRIAIEKELRSQHPMDDQVATFAKQANCLYVPGLSLMLSGRLRSLQAYLEGREKGVDAGLRKLGADTDPEIIRGRLLLLMEHQMFSVASDIIRPLQLHERWCDLAVTCLVRNREYAAAKHIIDWSEKQTDSGLRKRCILRYAESRYFNAFVDRPADSSIFPGELTDMESEEIRDVIATLEPIVMVVTGNRRVESELESRALQLAIRSNTVLCKLDAANKLMQLLMLRTPVPLAIAEFVLGEWVPLPIELPAKLRADHPGCLEATVYAAMLDGQFNNKAKEAFDILAEKSETVIASDQKELLATALCELAQLCGTEEMTRTGTLIQALVGDDHKITFRHNVTELFKGKAYEDACRLLEQRRDENDVVWLQMYAQYFAAVGDDKAALEYYNKASQLIPHPHLLEIVAQLGLKQGRFRASVEALEKRLLVSPNDVTDRRNLAIAYTKMRDYDQACIHFSKLQELGAATPDNLLDHAGCLVYCGKRDKALTIFNQLDALDEPVLAGVINKAHLLKSMDKSKDAFCYLESRQQLYWDQPEFVVTYLDIAMVADEDSKAHLAFQHLWELQDTGRTEHQYLVPKTLDDFKEYVEDYKQRRDMGCQKILQGHLPWVFVDSALRHVPYWGWRLRTQELPWVIEHPLDQAQVTVYSTNGYYIPHGDQPNARLTELGCPAKGTAVVADISSLVTLHRLGLLQKAASYFGTVYVPNEYMEQAVPNAERLVPQLSQKSALEKIQELFLATRLRIASEVDISGMPVIDEHTTGEQGHRYSLKDVVQLLQQAGRLTDNLASELATVAHQASGVADSHEALVAGQRIRITVSTLKALASINVLEDVVDICDVYITSEEREEVNMLLRTYAAQNDVLQWHNSLWEEIREDHNFKLVSCHEELSAILKLKAVDLPRDVSLWAMAYACQHGISLLADDRFCQMMTLNRPDALNCSAFGSDKAVEALCDEDVINADREADALLSLMRWRYRFIVPTVRFLTTVADRYSQHPPGRELREIASYIHASLRDPGLFSGLEPTRPPLPLALRIHQDIIAAVGEFIMSVWTANELKWSDVQAMELTQWAVSELLPSPPRNMWSYGQHLSSFVSDTILMMALFQSLHINDLRRANLALRTFADALGITPDEYTRAVTEVINAI